MRCLWGRVSLVVAMLCGFAAHSEAWAGIGNLWYDGPYVGDSPEAACAPVMARNGWELDHIDMMLSRGEAACKPTYESAMRTWGYYTWTVAFFNGGACAPGYTQLPDGNCEPNRSPERSCAVGHPVLPGTGTKVLNERDDGGSSELPLARSYRSNVLFWRCQRNWSVDVQLATPIRPRYVFVDVCAFCPSSSRRWLCPDISKRCDRVGGGRHEGQRTAVL